MNIIERTVLASAALVLAIGIAREAFGHDPYSSWKTNQGYSCCDDSDCRPTRTCTPLGGDLGVMIDGRCMAVPPSSLLRIPSPDGRSHACISPGALEPRCVVLGETRG